MRGEVLSLRVGIFEKGGKKIKDKVASPESVPIHLQ